MATTSNGQRLLAIEHSSAEDGTPTLVCKGRINLESANALRTEVKCLSSTHRTVYADLSGVEAVDSAGLGSILGTYVSARNDGCELVLVNLKSPGKRPAEHYKACDGAVGALASAPGSAQMEAKPGYPVSLLP